MPVLVAVRVLQEQHMFVVEGQKCWRMPRFWSLVMGLAADRSARADPDIEHTIARRR
jgi:hypothetical protein